MSDDLSTYETTRENAERAGELERVAKLCQEASGPSRDLDGTVWATLQGVTLLIWERPASSGEAMSYRGDLAYPDMPGVANYSSSLDAAASLIPEGFDWVLERFNDGLTIGARVGHNDPDRTSWGETPALALCAAALRARSEMVIKPWGDGVSECEGWKNV